MCILHIYFISANMLTFINDCIAIRTFPLLIPPKNIYVRWGLKLEKHAVLISASINDNQFSPR